MTEGANGLRPGEASARVPGRQPGNLEHEARPWERAVQVYCGAWAGQGFRDLCPQPSWASSVCSLGSQVARPDSAPDSPEPGGAAPPGGRGRRGRLVLAFPGPHPASPPSAFEERQRLRKQEIVGRILKEEAEEEHRRKKRSSPTKATGRSTLRDRTWGYILDVCEDRDTAALPRNLVVSQRSLSVTGTALQGSR